MATIFKHWEKNVILLSVVFVCISCCVPSSSSSSSSSSLPLSDLCILSYSLKVHYTYKVSYLLNTNETNARKSKEKRVWTLRSIFITFICIRLVSNIFYLFFFIFTMMAHDALFELTMFLNWKRWYFVETEIFGDQ